MRVVVGFGPLAGPPRRVEEPEGAKGVGSQPRQLAFRTRVIQTGAIPN